MSSSNCWLPEISELQLQALKAQGYKIVAWWKATKHPLIFTEYEKIRAETLFDYNDSKIHIHNLPNYLGLKFSSGLKCFYNTSLNQHEPQEFIEWLNR